MSGYRTSSRCTQTKGAARGRIGLLALVLACIASIVGGRAAFAAEPLNLVFAYGSEKDKWLKAVTQTFNDAQYRTDEGAIIHITLQPMGSGELVDALKKGDLKPHLVSPASELFLKLAEPGLLGDGAAPHLVKSPVVIAMWEDKARALGWPQKQFKWADVFDLAERKAGWKDFGHEEYGRFKFGHTHPEHSNSGLIAVVAQAYAATPTHKTTGLTLEDVNSEATAKLMAGIGRSVVYYGSSTGFMGDRMSKNPELLDAAVLYENMVIEHNTATNNANPPQLLHTTPAQRLVAIYPSDGTFMSDHPVGIVQKDWVKPAEKKAAEKYIAFLLDVPQQKKALEFGFRPGVDTVPVGAPVDAASGVDPAQPVKLMEVPSDPAVIRACQAVWRSVKKPANVILAIDISGSMNDGHKLAGAIKSAKEFIDLLGDKDKISILAFNSYLKWLDLDSPTEQWPKYTDLQKDVSIKVKGNRDRLKAALDHLKAEWQTKLYEGILDALKRLKPAGEGPGEISCLIILSDGKDFDTTVPPDKHPTLAQVIDAIQARGREHRIVVFTIAYGMLLPNGQMDKSDLDEPALKNIAAASGGEYKESLPAGLHKVLEGMAAFFSSQEQASRPH